MSEYKEGDILRVTYEGEYKARHNCMEVPNYGFVAVGKVTGRKVELVKKAVKPPEVGDVVRGEKAFQALPLGTVVHSDDHSPVLFLTEKGWLTPEGFEWTRPEDARTIVYLP